MSSFLECKEIAKKLPSYSGGKTFEGIEYFSVLFPEPIMYNASHSQIVKVTAKDSNAAYDHFVKMLKKHYDYKAP